jgi:transposase-like protein
MFPFSYRDFELMLLARGVEVDRTTVSATESVRGDGERRLAD